MSYFKLSGYQTTRSYEEALTFIKQGIKGLWMFQYYPNAEELRSLVRTSKLLKLRLGWYEAQRPIRIADVADVAEILSQEVNDSNPLEELRLHDCDVVDAGAIALGLFIQNNTTLISIDLAQPNMVDTAFLTKALEVNTTLKYMCINRMKLGSDGLFGLARGLKRNNGLEVLWLYNMALGNSGMIAYNMAIGNSGMIAIAKALEYNKSLLELHLVQTYIGDDGGVAVAACLAKNETLRDLDLHDNKLGDATAHAFAHFLGVNGNRSLRKLGLSCNDIQHEGRSSLLKMLGANMVIELRYEYGDNRIPSSIKPESPEWPEWAIKKQIHDILKSREAQREKRRLEAFEKAKGGEATGPWLRSKLMVVGRGAAGKTNTVRSLLGIQFNPSWDSTVGINLTEVTTASSTRWKKIKHTDFASNFIHRLAVEAADDHQEVEAKPPVQNRNTIQPQAEVNTERSQEVKTSIRKDEDVKFRAAENMKPTFQFEEELFIAHEDAKDAVRMSIWDYGGQSVFYTLHHLFLTRYGVYLVVFNMKKLLDSTDDSSEYLLFWLNSIKLHAPNAPVILVGTFLDKLVDDTESSGRGAETKLEQVSAIVSKLVKGFGNICAFNNLMYNPTSNKDKSGVQRLRGAIEHETTSADFVQTQVSLKWMRALDILLESSERVLRQLERAKTEARIEGRPLDLPAQPIDRGWIELTELKKELEDIGMGREEEIERMLCLFHELGVVLYFSSSVRLKEVVIWKPQWLIEKLSLVIRDKNVHDYDNMKLEQAQLTQDLDSFLQDGIASRDLLEFLWEKSQVDYLIELMRHLLLLSDCKFSQEELYLIPSMVSDTEAPTRIGGVSFHLKFGFLPLGVFERVCCLCVGYSSSLPQVASPQLYKTSCIVDLGTKGLLQVGVQGGNTIKVAVTEETEACLRLDFFLSMMRRIQHDFMHGGLEWQVFVQDGDKFVQHEVAQAQRLQPWIRKEEVSDSAAIDKLLDL